MGVSGTQDKAEQAEAQLAQTRRSAAAQMGAASKRAHDAEAATATMTQRAVAAAAAHERTAAEADALVQSLLVRTEQTHVKAAAVTHRAAGHCVLTSKHNKPSFMLFGGASQPGKDN